MLRHPLIEGWRKCRLDAPPYLFPGDAAELNHGMVVTYKGFDEYATSSALGASADRHLLHVGLLPIPYVGDLAKASIFVLMLNPGLSHGDYHAEENSPDYRRALIRNLRQGSASSTHPFIFLDPRFAWHPGFDYWHGKLHTVIEAAAERSQISYQRAMGRLAKRLACLELLPYHSRAFGAGSLLRRLPSVQAMRSFVHEMLLPKVTANKAIIIVTRGAKYWQLQRRKNIVVYDRGESRSAHITLKSRGGKNIARFLGI